jgi:hypothetical protein
MSGMSCTSCGSKNLPNFKGEVALMLPGPVGVEPTVFLWSKVVVCLACSFLYHNLNCAYLRKAPLSRDFGRIDLEHGQKLALTPPKNCYAPASFFVQSVAHRSAGAASLLPIHVPVSPFVHPPAAAAYDPFADEPSFVTVPVKITFWPFSLSVMLMEFPLSVPDAAAESAQGSAARLNEPEIFEPSCAIVPVAVI